MTCSSLYKFPVVKTNNRSIANRRLVHGVGVNDADYVVKPTVDGRQVLCPFYITWKDMLKRCYCEKFQARYPSYRGCSVVQEWLSFICFREWMVQENWQGLELDKDLLFPGNKLYSADNCVFVSGALNNLLLDRAADRGKYPQGVSFQKRDGRYRARINIFGKLKFLGYYPTPEAASAVYREAKRSHILRVACAESDIRVKQGLARHAALLIKGE